MTLDVKTRHPGARQDDGAGIGGRSSKAPIEDAAVDDADFGLGPLVPETVPGRRMETGGVRRSENGIASDPRQREGLGTEDAGTVDRLPDPLVLLEHADREPLPREELSGVEPCRAAPDDDDIVTHRPTWRRHPSAHSLRPRCSHRPRNVIQNESAMSRRSSHTLCRRR